MNNATVFARAGQTLVVRHCRTNDGAVLFVLGDDRDSQSYCFTEFSALKKFQSRLEHFLIETGWYVLDPSPHLTPTAKPARRRSRRHTSRRIEQGASAAVLLSIDSPQPGRSCGGSP